MARRAVWHALAAVGHAVTVATLSERLGQHPNTIREHLDHLVAAGHVERIRSQPVGRGRPAWLYRAIGPGHTAGGSDAASGPECADDIATGNGIGASDGPDGIEDIDGSGSEYAALALALIEEVARSDPNPRAIARQAGERWGRSLAGQRAGAHIGARASGRAGANPAGATPTEANSVGGIATDANPTGAALPAGSTSVRPSDAVLDMLAELRFEPEPAPRAGVVRLTTCPLLDAARRSPDLVCQVHLGIVRGALERVGGDPDGVALEPFAEPGACLLTLPDRR